MKKEEAKQAGFNLIVPKGTQIVLLNAVKILNENRFHPKGAVGVVSGVPNDAFHAYRVRFTDDSEAMAHRKDFSIKKHFQNEQSGLVSQLENFALYDFVIYRCVVGSRAFGLDTEASDTDRRGIYLPPADVHWSMFGVPEQLENRENEECYWELRKFLILALKANPNILECLYTPLVEYASELARELLSMRGAFLSKLVYQTYNGYVMSQFKKLEQDLRATGEIRRKHAMHLIRLLLQGIEILREADLTVRVEENREKLLAIKRGDVEWREVNNWRLRLHKDFENALAATRLPERPDYERANEFLIKARRSMVKNDE
ncbi:MAG TPA: nucleotidyltransferase domain-containing protein [Pyrinomonadaceae bacterium]